MKGLTYPALAARFDYGGEWDWRKRVTRSGLRRFLIAVARSRRHGAWPRYEEIYSDHLFAYWQAMELGIRLPAKLAAADKARVRALLVSAPFEVRNGRIGRWAGLR